MKELSEQEYDVVRQQVELAVGVEASDNFFYNTLAYLTPTEIILRDMTAIRITPEKMVDTVLELIEEEKLWYAD